jgi:pimeloyl-ACP methyl ester carboxylesterase
MKLLVSIVLLFAVLYTLLLISMFVFQRSLLYFPVPYQQGISAQEIQVDNDGLTLSGWVLNPGRSRAMIYFGGNSEAIENNIVNFEADLSDYSVYLIHYRGYGKSEGKPTEDGLYSDALAIYDAIKEKYESISSMGRSLGSGVAVYLAAHREIGKLILLTPYDSIVKVAQVHYPFVPAHYVARDRFEAFQYAPGISASVLIVTAELDRVVPVERGLKLREYFSPEQVTYKMIPSAAHNNITEFEEYRQLLKRFVASP